MPEDSYDSDLLDLLFAEEPHLFGYAVLMRVSAGSARAQAKTLPPSDEKLRAEGRFQAYDDAWHRSLRALGVLLVEWGEFGDIDEATGAVRALIVRSSNEIARREIAKRKRQEEAEKRRSTGKTRADTQKSGKAQDLQPFAEN